MKSIFVIVLILLSSSGFAQMGFGKPEEVAEIKKRPLLVMLEEEDQKKISKLAKKPEELALYQSEIRRVNDALKEASKYWTFHSTVDYKTRTQIKKLQESKNKDYAILSFTRYTVNDWHSNYRAKPGNPSHQGNSRHITYNGNTGSLTTTTSYWYEQRYLSGTREIASVYIDLIEGLENGRPVYLQNLPNLFPTLGDLVFGVQMIESYLESRLSGKKRSEGMEDLKEYAIVLKTKTLLVDKEDIKDNLKEEDISKSYPYKYIVTDYPTIEKAILEKDKNYVYVQITPMMGTSGYIHMVIDAEKGIVIGYSTPSPIGVKGVGGAERVTSKHLKNYAKFVE